MMKKATHSIPDLFPIKDLRNLDFGQADGHRDQLLEETFIVTSSIKQFFQNRHSLIVGAIGTGKSTLYKQLKENSHQFDEYKGDLIVPLEESLSFTELSQLAKDFFKDRDEKILFQLIWKFNILLKIAIRFSSMDDFPKNNEEKKINDFLRDSDSKDTYINIVAKIRKLVTGANLKIETKVSDFPITFSAGIGEKKSDIEKKINLEEIQRSISKAIQLREFNCATVIIDKIDKFVAGVEYSTQRSFLSALLELDDDLSGDANISLKIFLREDLYKRLEFSTLGYDKISDNTLFLKWSKEETFSFLAARIIFALRKARIANPLDLLKATNLSEFDLSLREKLILNSKIPNLFKKLISPKAKTERQTSLYNKFDKAIITKIFPRKVIHFCAAKQTFEDICIFDFISTHFIDSNEVCTPRYMIIFLKEVASKAAAYYDNNPDQYSELLLVQGDYEWDLFKKNCVYDAYLAAKEIFTKNISTVDIKWSTNFNTLLMKRGNKTNFDFKWVRANIPDISETETIDFLSFMQVIGFLKIVDPHPDIRKRGYELPILYKTSPVTTE